MQGIDACRKGPSRFSEKSTEQCPNQPDAGQVPAQRVEVVAARPITKECVIQHQAEHHQGPVVAGLAVLEVPQIRLKYR